MLTILSATGGCQYGTSLSFGNQNYSYNAQSITGIFGSSFWCEDRNGTLGSWNLSIQAGDLVNTKNPMYTIGSGQIEIQNTPTHLTNGACAFYT
jgi:hypothetical protein